MRSYNLKSTKSPNFEILKNKLRYINKSEITVFYSVSLVKFAILIWKSVN